MEMCGYSAFGVHRTEPLQGRPWRIEGSEDPTAWLGILGAHLLPQQTPLSAGPRQESGSEPAGGAASPPQEPQGREAETASRAARDLGARPGAGSSSSGISFSISLVGPRLEILAFYIPGSVQRLPRRSWAPGFSNLSTEVTALRQPC